MRRLLAIAIVLAATHAAADPFPVDYVVDYKAFKSGTTSTTELSFNFFDDAACSNALGSVPITAGDSALVVEKISRINVKGVKPKAPAVAVLRTTVDLAGPQSPVYMTVTGTGVTPAAGAPTPRCAWTR